MKLGILMLDNAFERYPGDVGNPATWSIPIVTRKIKGATTERATTLDDDSFLEAFIAAGHELVADGATAITTSCGFLAIYQKGLARRLTVPVATSALLQIAIVERLLPPGKRAGVVTFNGKSLGRRHLEGVGAPLDTPIVGLPEGGRFRSALLGDPTGDSYDAREREAVDSARKLVAAHPEVAALVLECTNLVPHSAAIHDAVKLPVYDFMTLVDWYLAGLTPKRWPRL